VHSVMVAISLARTFTLVSKGDNESLEPYGLRIFREDSKILKTSLNGI
jgi:hypothetical protein